jgi:uncharacterized damage-inducible protein DinB
MVYIVPGRTRELSALFADASRKPTSWSGFNQYSRRVWAGLEKYFAGVTASDLSRKVKAPWMPGRYTAGDAVVQTSLEQAHHLGEIIALYWQMDREPPEMTWIDTQRGA